MLHKHFYIDLKIYNFVRTYLSIHIKRLPCDTAQIINIKLNAYNAVKDIVLFICSYKIE